MGLIDRAISCLQAAREWVVIYQAPGYAGIRVLCMADWPILSRDRGIIL